MPTKKSKKTKLPDPKLINKELVWYAPVSGLNPDGVQYKPYGVHFGDGGEPLFYVELRCPEEEVISSSPIILTPEGACLVAKSFAATTQFIYAKN